MAAAPGVPGAGVSSLLSLVSVLSLSLAELSSPASGCGVSGASCVTTGRSSLARRRKAGLICCWFGSLVAPITGPSPMKVFVLACCCWSWPGLFFCMIASAGTRPLRGIRVDLAPEELDGALVLFAALDQQLLLGALGFEGHARQFVVERHGNHGRYQEDQQHGVA